jgi:hypothetical protein
MSALTRSDPPLLCWIRMYPWKMTRLMRLVRIMGEAWVRRRLALSLIGCSFSRPSESIFLRAGGRVWNR